MKKVLETARLILRELEPEDAAFILQLLNEPAFHRFIGDKGVRSLANARDYIEQGPRASYRDNGFGLNATCLRDSTPIGICGLVKRDTLPVPDVGFAFLEQYWGQGYAAEAAEGVIRHTREELKLPRVLAIVNPDNQKSVGVLEKIGLRFERVLHMPDANHDVKLFTVDLETTP